MKSYTQIQTTAIKEISYPTDVKGVQQLEGFVNYLAKFLPHISEMFPVQHYTETDAPWTCSQTHEEAFEKVKKVVSEARVLRYYDINKPLFIQCDASEKGLGATLLQESQPLAYTI